MRKATGILSAAALVLPVGVLTAPAGAAAGTSCNTISAGATFKPALPKLGSSAKVVSTITAVGTFGGCVGGGVTSGAVKLTAKFTKPGNSATLATSGSANRAKGTESITWSTKQTSTITLTLTGVQGQPKQARIAGTITAGLFKGSKQSGTIMYVVPKAACTTTSLSKFTMQQLTAQNFK